MFYVNAAIIIILILVILMIFTFILLIKKSYDLSKYLKQKSEKKYKEIHGLVREPVFGFQMYDNLSYWSWIFKDLKDDDKTTKQYKDSLRKIVYFIAGIIFTIILCSIYIYIISKKLNG